MSKSEDIVPHAHNEYLEILSETGATGVLLFIGILFLFFRFGLRSLAHNSGSQRTVLLGMLCGIAGVLIDGLASMNLRTIPVATGFWLIAGISTTYFTIPSFEKTFRIFPWMRNLQYIPALLLIGGMVWYVPTVYNQYISGREYLDGLVYKYQGNIIGATSKFSEAIRFNPLHAEARLYLAANYIEQKQFQAGYDQLTVLLTYHPYIPKGHLLKAVCAFELGKFDEHRKEMTTELGLTTNPQSLSYAALFAGKRNQPQEERTYLLRLLEKSIAGNSPEYVPSAIERLGEMCTTGLSSECDTIVQQVVEKFRDTPPILIAAAQYFTSVEKATEAGKAITAGLTLQTLHGEQRRILEELQKGMTK
jgi:tetratricopeptide (TPR) repeat protein